MKKFLAFSGLLLLNFALVTNLPFAQTSFPDWHAANKVWVAAGYDSHYFRSDNSSTLAWGETYNLQTYNLMYQTDGDTLWLHKLAEHGQAISSNAKDVPLDCTNYHPLYQDGFFGWGTWHYTGDYDEYLVHDGHFCTELAKFIRIVYEDQELYRQFGSRADSLLRFLERHVVGKWYATWYTPRVAYPGNISTNDTYHRWIGGQNLHRIPVNRYAAFGNFLLELSRIARSRHYRPVNADFVPWYDRVAREMAQAFRTMLHYDNLIDAYLWDYSTEGHSNDLSHSAIEIAFAFDCYQNGVEFSETDMKRFANTFTRYLWKNPYNFQSTELWDSFNKSEWDYVLDPYIRKWALLGTIDPLVCAVAGGVMRSFAENHNYSSGVFATGIAALAHVNRAAAPIVASVGIIVNEIVGDGDQFPDPGEELELLIKIANWGNQVVDSMTVTIDCPDDRVQLLQKTCHYFNIASVDTGINHANPFTFKVKPDVVHGGTIPIYLRMQSGTNSRSDSVKLSIGPAPVLLVDDDGRATFETFYQAGVLDSICQYQYWNVSEFGSPASYLSDFDKVIWFTGDEKYNTLTRQDRDGIQSYLDNGGKLLLFSSGVEGDMLDNSPPDTAFFINFLHALPSDNQKTVQWLTVETIVPEFFPTKFLVLTPQKNSTFRAIETGAGATAIFKYYFGTAGLYSNAQHHFTYMTFGLENVNQGATDAEKIFKRRYLLSKLFEIVDLPARVRSLKTHHPEQFTLTAFPNPFNSKITIEFHLPQKSMVKFSVHDCQGRLVYHLFKAELYGGNHQLYWDGRNDHGRQTGSGVYFIRAQVNQFVTVYKICQIR